MKRTIRYSDIMSCEYGEKPPEFVKSKSGRSYEKTILSYLKNSVGLIPGWKIEYNPWITYITKQGQSFACEPDVVMINRLEKKIIIIEIKTWQHLVGAKELGTLYIPIMRKMYKGYDVKGIVVSKNKGKFLNKELIFNLENLITYARRK